MSNLLDITGADIAQLDDATLRGLIGLLCEADYRLAGLPVTGITWGGHQDASDGGLDVVVRGEVPPPPNSDVPRPVTGFQVKKSRMPRGDILKEMRPAGRLRSSIQELIEAKGAYILVSSSDSTTERSLKARQNAMREAVADEDPQRSLLLDFLDRGRVATWVRCHTSLVIWVRNKVNRPVLGWRPYENWTNSPGGKDGNYLLDDGLRLLDGTEQNAPPLSAEDGLRRLRSVLSAPSTSVRLVGLSGVGKTRLVQAMFDDSIGHNAINPRQAIYTDMSDMPVPEPCILATQLIADEARQVLIVDNCPPDLHRRVTKICSQPHSTVSVLTVEYDVRDDLPEGTSVFRLEPASQELIEKLIRNRFSHLGQVDAGTIAAFAGGNARVAIALAATVQHGETLSGFRDEELFERLFRQRHSPNEGLLASAAACSLVYSFDVTAPESTDSELHALASLVGISGVTLYGDVAVLHERQLIQSRSRWRAVLPHAIANRLAARGLRRIPYNTLMGVFLNGNSERLLRSFARRLGYLHDCRDAIAIVAGWLGTNGWIGGSIDNLTSVGMDVLASIAPVAPEMTLATIERAANGERGPLFTSIDNAHCRDLIQLLQQLAYDPELFCRSVELLCRYALSGGNNDASNTARRALQCLSQVYGSGTHAPLASRAKIVRELAGAKDVGKQELGFVLLDAALKIRDVEFLNVVSFGARPRTYGYQPSIREDLARWCATFVDICADLAMSDQPYAHDARKLLANSFRGLWSDAGVYDALEDAASRIHRRAAWNEGWLAVRSVIQYDQPEAVGDARERLNVLEDLLRPRDLLEETRTYVLSDERWDITFGDGHADFDCPSERWRLAGDKCRSLGAQMAQCPDALAVLLQDVMCSCSTWVVDFGRGLAYGSSDRWQLWGVLRVAFENSPPEKRRIDLVLGYLSSCAESDPGLYSAILDTLVKDELLAEWLPVLQTTSAIDQRGIERLHEFLDCQASPVVWFRALARGCSHECINDDELAGLLTKVLSRKDGLDATLEILWMRLCHSNGKVPNGSSQLMAVARNALLLWTRDHERSGRTGDDYRLAEIAHTCLSGPDGLPDARRMAQQLAAEVFEGRLSVPECPMLLASLAECQPLVFLDAFLTPGNVTPYWVRRVFSDHHGRGCGPFDQMSTDVLLAWCNADPSIRYPIVASAISGFVESKATGAPQWQPIVYAIIEHAPEPAVVLERLAETIMPRSWCGSLADVLERRSVIFRELVDHNDAEVRGWATSHVCKMEEAIRREREEEEKCEGERNERFED